MQYLCNEFAYIPKKRPKQVQFLVQNEAIRCKICKFEEKFATAWIKMRQNLGEENAKNRPA